MSVLCVLLVHTDFFKIECSQEVFSRGVCIVGCLHSRTFAHVLYITLKLSGISACPVLLRCYCKACMLIYLSSHCEYCTPTQLKNSKLAMSTCTF